VIKADIAFNDRITSVIGINNFTSTSPPPRYNNGGCTSKHRVQMITGIFLIRIPNGQIAL
jgi:hypothetical protein